MIRLKHFLSLIFIFLATLCYSQLNLKVGYSLGYTNPQVHNSLVQEFNAANTWLEKPLKDMHIFHGLVLGLRYKIESVAFEFSWYNKYGRISSDGIDPTDDSDYFKDFFYRYNGGSFGYETYFGNVGIGASIDASWSGIRSKFTGRRDRFKVVRAFGWSSHFNVSFNFEANNFMAFSIRPYVQIPWSDFDLSPFRNELSDNPSTEPITDNFMNYGVMFIFYNGQ